MKLRQCLKTIRSEHIPTSDLTIRFYNANNIAYGECAMIPTTICVDDLYNNWYRDAYNCPENEEFVFGVTIAQESTGKSYLIETYYGYTFENLMAEIENELYK